MAKKLLQTFFGPYAAAIFLVVYQVFTTFVLFAELVCLFVCSFVRLLPSAWLGTFSALLGILEKRRYRVD